MARKTFISYKYSEATELRDRIIDALGADASYYRGETSDSPNLTDFTTETIKDHLRDMIYPTSVTIMITSPNVSQSDWVEWEIGYSLRQTKREDRISRRNGVVAVVQKESGDCSWLQSIHTNNDGCRALYANDDLLPRIIRHNRFNQTPPVYSCSLCKTVNALTGSYIALVNEDDFLTDPSRYIENAYKKSLNANDYAIAVNL